MSKLKHIPKEKIEEAVKNSKSLSGVLNKLGISSESGSANRSIKNLIKNLNIDMSHFTGKLWNKGIETGPVTTVEDYFSGKRSITSHKLKQRLIKDDIFKHECSKCLLSIWNDLPIPLELDHINGNHNDNSKENLRLLCPNCHAQTATYCNKKKNNAPAKYTIDELKKAVKNNNSPYQVLVTLKLNPKGGGNYNSFFKLVKEHKIDISHFYV